MTSLYLFDNNQDLIKIIPQKDLIQARQKEELQENDLPIDRFTAEYKLDAFKDVEAIHYFAVKDLNKPNQFHMYFLKQPIINENTVLLEGVQLAYKELKHFIIQEIHPQNRQAEFMLNQALQGTGWRVGYVAETVQASQHFYFMPALETLKVISGLFGIELVFKVEISGQKITDKWVEAYNRRGSRTMKRFTHGSNLLSIKGTIERDNVYTALIGRGRGEETEGGGFGRRITFEEVEWSVANGDPVDKPLGLNYVEIPSATEEYGINMPDGSKAPAMGVVEFQDIEEPDELLNAVYNELAYRIRPLVQYGTTVADVGDVELGEVVGVHRYDLDLHYETRIFKLTRDYLNPRRTPIELGDKVIESRRDREVRTQKTIGNINREQTLIREEVSYVVKTADGMNTITYGNVEPDRKRVGDYWVRDHPQYENETQWLVWNGDAWEILIDTRNTTENSERIEEAKQQADTAKQNAEDVALDLEEGTSFYKHTNDIGLASKNADGSINSIINLGSDGTAYIGGENIVLDGNTIVDGTFTVTDTIFAENMSISKFTVGTLDAANVNLINVNVNNLVGDKSSFVQTAWNDSANNSVYIDGNGFHSIQNNNEVLIADGRIEGVGSGNTYTLNNQGLYTNSQDNDVTHFGVNGIQLSGGAFISRFERTGLEFSTPSYIHMRAWGTPSFSMYSTSNSSWKQLNMQNNRIWNIPRIQFANTGYIESFSTSLEIGNDTHQLTFVSNGSNALTIQSSQAVLNRNLNMGGNDINAIGTLNYQSDERLKEDIIDTKRNSLDIITNLRYKEYYWKNKNQDNQRQFGLIAQEVDSQLRSYDSENDIYGINQNVLIHTIGHGLQQLSKEHENTLLVASHAYLLAEQHEEELECLRKEVKELKEEIEELRGMGA